MTPDRGEPFQPCGSVQTAAANGRPPTMLPPTRRPQKSEKEAKAGHRMMTTKGGGGPVTLLQSATGNQALHPAEANGAPGTRRASPNPPRKVPRIVAMVKVTHHQGKSIGHRSRGHDRCSKGSSKLVPNSIVTHVHQGGAHGVKACHVFPCCHHCHHLANASHFL